MAARTGSQFLEGLRKTKREIWLDSERIGDVTTHPKLRGGAESIAAMFDRQHAYAAECLFTDPESGELTNVSHMIPRSKDDLWRRHAGLTRLSEGSMGIMGRTPDYMNMKFSGFASAPHVWAGDAICSTLPRGSAPATGRCSRPKGSPPVLAPVVASTCSAS